jgi:TonB-linked SusC/RagA family outer membrane protein
MLTAGTALSLLLSPLAPSALQAQTAPATLSNGDAPVVVAAPRPTEPAFAPTANATATVVVPQSSQVQGNVKDDTGAVLRGVTVRVKGGSKGAITDKDGNYSVSANKGDVLVFSLIGYSKKEIVVGDNATINIVLGFDVQRLEDVVVVGYGSAIKKDITGNIAKVKAAEIADVPAPSFDMAIQGKAAGVVVTQGSGKLGQGMQIRVRGASSISAGQDPLYVVDGVPLTASLGGFDGAFTNSRSVNPLADINPQDIESIDILKDAAAAAIYGSRGANGVVLVTTKKGKAGKTSINFNLQRGFSAPAKTLRFLNRQQYFDYFRTAAGNSDRIDGIDPKDPDSYTSSIEGYIQEQSLGLYDPSKPTDFSKVPDTDWGSAVLRSDAPTTQADLNLSGGNEKTMFYLSGQYLDQEGILIGNKLNRLSGRLNVDHKVSDIFKAGFNLSITRTNNNRLAGDNAFSSPLQAVALAPVTPLIDPSTGLPTGTPPGDPNIPVYYNPIIGVNNSYRNYVVLRNLGNIFGELNIIEGLKLRGQFGFDLATQSEEQWFGAKTVRNSGLPLGGITNLNQVVENFSGSAFLNFNKTFDASTIDIAAGTEYQQSRTKTSTTSAQDLPSDAFRLAVAAAKPTLVTATQQDFTFLSYFARANYKFSEWFLVSGSARIDGSSRFGANNRYGFFPAGSVGVVLSELDFLKDNEVLSFLKVRASAGRTGNAEIGNFRSRGLVAGDAIYNLAPGTRPFQLPNPNLTWETTDQFDIGIDFGFLNNRITGEIDVYQKNSSGLLLTIDVPGTTGFRQQTRNVGSMLNRGIEFVLNTDNINVEGFSWKTSLNFAANANTVQNLNGQILTSGIGNLPSRAQESQPIGVFYTPEWAGVDPANGNALWYRNDTLGSRTTTSVYSQAKPIVAGNPLPSWTGAVTNTFSFLGMIDFSFQFNAVIGNKINFFGVGQYASAGSSFEDNVGVDQLNYWSANNKNASLPEPRYLKANGGQASSRFIIDGSFVRLRSATLAFNFPKVWLSDWNIGVTNLRVYATALNLLTFTNYRGWDPEVNSDDFGTNIAQGIDFYTAPQARTIMFGISVGF